MWGSTILIRTITSGRGAFAGNVAETQGEGDFIYVCIYTHTLRIYWQVNYTGFAVLIHKAFAVFPMKENE